MVSDERLTPILRAYSRDLLRFLEYRLGSDDAADALGEAMLAAWRRVADLPADDGEARLWLFGIARNTVLNAHRGRVRRRALAGQVRRHRPAATEPGADSGVEVRDAVQRLDPDLAELIRLVHWDGFAVAEAARILGIPASTAASRYQRAKRTLRRVLLLEEEPIRA